MTAVSTYFLNYLRKVYAITSIIYIIYEIVYRHGLNMREHKLKIAVHYNEWHKLFVLLSIGYFFSKRLLYD